MIKGRWFVVLFLIVDIINSWREHIEMINSLVETAMRLCGQPAAREDR